jgi:hypothetical protein
MRDSPLWSKLASPAGQPLVEKALAALPEVEGALILPVGPAVKAIGTADP